MNYIKHLTGFFEKVSTDFDLNPTHISLYMAIFQLWNQNRFQNPISISRDELMRISKIASTATYHKCIKDLTKRGYVIYKPSFNPFKGSLLEVCNLDFYTKPIQKKELKKRSTLLINDEDNEQVLNNYQTSSEQLHYINSLNNSNNINLDKQSKKIEKPNSSKNRNVKEEKNLAKKEVKEIHNFNTTFSNSDENSKNNYLIPTIEEAKQYFLENKYTELEAEKYFNYFQSNGWLVGGKTKMKDWKAAAKNWMLNTHKFSKKLNTENLNPNHLHTPNTKDYAEAL